MWPRIARWYLVGLSLVVLVALPLFPTLAAIGITWMMALYCYVIAVYLPLEDSVSTSSLSEQHGILFKIAKLTKRRLTENLSTMELDQIDAELEQAIQALDRKWAGWETR